MTNRSRLLLVGAISWGVLTIAWFIVAIPRFFELEVLYLDCDYPLEYSIGTVPPEAGITQREFRTAILESERRWEEALGTNVFMEGDGGIAISFIDDGRKQQIEQWLEILDAKEKIYNDAWYEHERAEHEDVFAKIKSYFHVQALYRDYADYYDSVDYDMARNNDYAQGLYYLDTKRLEVYYYQNRNDLLFVIMHELGHAAGLEHTKEPKSIMYEARSWNEDLKAYPSPLDVEDFHSLC